MIIRRRYGLLVLLPAVLLLLVYFVAPLLYFFRYSVRPPSATGFAGGGFTMSNFTAFFSDSFLVGTLVRSVVIALVATVVTLVLSLPVAYFMVKSKPWLKGLLIILAVFPLLTGSVVRSIGWVAILGYSGVLNYILQALHLTASPLDILQTTGSVTMVIVSVVVPVTILVLHAAMEQVDPSTERAALSLGAGQFRSFWQVTMPQIVPGITAATSLVFVLSVNAYATPLLVGSSRIPMIAPQIYDVITAQGNLPGGAAMSVIVVVFSLLLVAIYGLVMRRVFERWRAAA